MEFYPEIFSKLPSEEPMNPCGLNALLYEKRNLKR